MKSQFINFDVTYDVAAVREAQRHAFIKDMAHYQAKKIEAYKAWSDSNGAYTIIGGKKVSVAEVNEGMKDCMPEDFKIEPVRETAKPLRITPCLKNSTPSSPSLWAGILSLLRLK